MTSRRGTPCDRFCRGGQLSSEKFARRPLAGATTADALADRRFEAAETPASLRALDRELGRLSLVIEQSRKRIAGAQAEKSAAVARWIAAIASIGQDLTTTEFEAWRGRRTRVLLSWTRKTGQVAKREFRR
jgi:hypothetical protein